MPFASRKEVERYSQLLPALYDDRGPIEYPTTRLTAPPPEPSLPDSEPESDERAALATGARMPEGASQHTRSVEGLSVGNVWSGSALVSGFSARDESSAFIPGWDTPPMVSNWSYYKRGWRNGTSTTTDPVRTRHPRAPTQLHTHAHAHPHAQAHACTHAHTCAHAHMRTCTHASPSLLPATCLLRCGRTSTTCHPRASRPTSWRTAPPRCGRRSRSSRGARPSDDPLRTTHCPLRTAYYPLPATHYALPATHYSLPTTHYSLPTTRYPLPTTHYPRLTTHYRREAEIDVEAARRDAVLAHRAHARGRLHDTHLVRHASQESLGSA